MTDAMNRRIFLKSFLIGAAGCLGGIYFYKVFRWRDPARMISDIVRRDLSYFDISEDELLRFSRDFMAEYGVKYEKIISATRYGVIPVGTEASSQRQFAQFICDTFLKSTTFWQTPLLERGEIRYLRLYDPFSSPCSNVLAIV